MAKNDWKALQAQFEYDHDRYGTTAKDWCEAKGLNYASARRYIKVRKTAQPKNAQKRTAQSKSAQSAQKSKAVRKNKSSGKNEKSDSSNASNSTSDGSREPHLVRRERDESGRFQQGHSLSIGNAGNTGEPTNAFKPGNQAARKSGIYSRLFDSSYKEKYEFCQLATLEDELDLARTRMQAGIEYLQRIAEDMINATTVDERISLYDNYNKTENRLDVLTARVESITKTLSSIGIDVVNKEKIKQDTARIKNASRKLALEADALQKEGKGDDTPIASIVEEIQSMNKSGLMSE